MAKLCGALLAVLLVLLSLASCGQGKAVTEDGSRVQDSSDFTFVVCGDPNGLSPQFKQIVEAAKGADFLVIVGDLTPSGSDAEFQKIYDYLQASGVEYYAIRGDNDRLRDPSGAVFSRYFGPLWRSFDYQNSHFQLLDDSDGMLGYPREELVWMEEDLAAAGAPLKFAFAHIPPGAPPDLSSDYDAYEQSRETSDQALEMWQSYEVNTVFSGHLHAYMIYRADNPRILVTGGAGAALHLPEGMGGYYNYLLVHVQGRNVDVQVVKLQ